MLNYICDSCGQSGQINPPVTQKMVDVELHGHKIQVPETKTVKRQNLITGKMEAVQEPVVTFDGERIIRVFLELGPQERIAREFCTVCFEKVRNQVQSAWDTLTEYDPQ